VLAYPNMAALPEAVDLAVIATPARTVPDTIRACAEARVKAAIIISAGFKEVGAEGAALEREISSLARQANMRIIGPNCLGLMRPQSGLNASFASTIAQPGRVAFISQSGALCTAVLDWSLAEHIGFSAFISVGSMLDVGWGDLIDYLGEDPETESIVLYMESIGDARAFMSAARQAALTKPIIVIKAGRTEEATKAAVSHTGSLTGSDDVLDAAFRRCGVLRVNTIAELFYMAEALAKQPRPRGSRLAILTNAGGPGVLATDSLISDGGQLAPLIDATREALNEVLPPAWSHANPVDVLGDAGPDRYVEAVEALKSDPTVDGLLVVLTPQAMTDPTRTAETIASHAEFGGKPILASWMGGVDVAAGQEILNKAGIPTFPYPDTAAHVFNNMWRYSHNLRALYETPVLSAEYDKQGSACLQVRNVIDQVTAEGRTVLTEPESKTLLAAYQIPTVQTVVATSPDEAVQAAEQIGYPVVLKLYSTTITHKTDVGGVRLNLHDAESVRGAYRAIEQNVVEKAGAEHFQGVTVQPMIERQGVELILGSSVDIQFGPVMLFGAGGVYVELYKDRALGLPPLNTVLARRMMEQTTIYQALGGIRGSKAVDVEALEEVLVRFSQLVVEQPRIKEIDINPLLASHEGIVALDARVVLYDSDVPIGSLPKPAIRPYPHRYAGEWTMPGGESLVIRPIKAEDEPRMVEFHKTLSPLTVHGRYFGMVSLPARIQHDRLARVCFTDYDREVALVAVQSNPESEDRIVAVARLVKDGGTNSAEFAIVVSDPLQGHGLGSELLQRLIEVGRAEGVGRIRGEVLADNRRMLQLCDDLGFSLRVDYEAGVVSVELDLSGA
jgi:acetyltransferase